MNSLADLNIESLLSPVSSELPCGKNLEHENEFLQLENTAKFIPERHMGEIIIPEAAPDWKKVRDLSIELLGRSKDIQIGMHLTCALLWTEGFSGFAQGLSLIHGLLDKYWESVHPCREPDDLYPVQRLNTLDTLNDYRKILAPLKQIRLTRSKAGEFSWHDVESAQSGSAGSDRNIPDPLLIEAAFLETDLASLRQQQQAVEQLLALSRSITALVVEKSASACSPDFSKLNGLLKGIDDYLVKKIKQRNVPESESRSSDEAPPLNHPVTGGNTGGIRNRDDVMRALDAVCKYFESSEPSSPVPFFMQRAKKLLSMNFMEILQDVAPDAVNQAEKICGAYKDDRN